MSGIANKFNIDLFIADNNCNGEGPSYYYTGLSADDSTLPSYFSIDSTDGSINVDISAPV